MEGKTTDNISKNIQVMKIQATVPHKVQLIDLEKLGQVIGCTQEEVVEGLHAQSAAVDVTGVILESGTNKSVVFETTQTTNAEEEDLETGIDYGAEGKTKWILAEAAMSYQDDPSLVIGVTPSGQDSEDFQSVKNESIVIDEKVFEGFRVDVGHVDSDASDSDLFQEHSRLLQEEELNLGLDHKRLVDGTNEPMIMSIPLDMCQEPQDISKAYLISMPVEVTANQNPNKLEASKEMIQTTLTVPKLHHPSTYDTDKFTGEQEDAYELPLLEHTLSYLPNHLPTDVEYVTIETLGDKNKCVKAVVERRVPMIGYVILVAALVGASSYGAAMQFQTGTDALLKLFWRMNADALFFLPLALRGLQLDNKMTLTFHDFGELIVCAACFVIASAGFILALNDVDAGTVFLFSGTHSIILVLGKLVIGMTVPLLEGIGAAVGVLGGMLTVLGPSDSPGNGSIAVGTHTCRGELLAFSSAAGFAGYLLLACRLRNKMDLFTFSCLNFTISSILLLGLMALVGVTFEISTDTSMGIFGWMNLQANRLPLELYVVVVVDLIGTVGFVAVMKYFEALVISVVMLLEPAIAVVFSILLGIGGIPGEWTYIGGFFVTLGCLMVVSSASSTTESYSVTDALSEVNTESKLALNKNGPNGDKNAISKMDVIDPEPDAFIYESSESKINTKDRNNYYYGSVDIALSRGSLKRKY